MPKEKEKCDGCQKEREMQDPDNWYLGKHYHGQKDGKLIWVCLDCYSTKKQKYLQNYQVFYRNYFDKDGLVYYEHIKRNEQDCYAGYKDQNGKVLQQQNCSHCQPWKFPSDNGNKEKCANCGKALGNAWFSFCSLECIDTYRNKNPQQQKPPIIPPKNNSNENGDVPKPTKTCSVCGKDTTHQEVTYIFRGNNGEKKDFCSIECLKKSNTQKDNPQQNDPPKSPNNNSNDKGMPTGLKIFFWIAGTALIIGSIGIMLYKISKKKKNSKEYNKKMKYICLKV